MFNKFFIPLFVFSCFSFNVLAEDFDEVFSGAYLSSEKNTFRKSTQALVVAAVDDRCWAKANEKYKLIKPVAYICGDASAKMSAERVIAGQENIKKASERKLAAQKMLEKERQRKLSEASKPKDTVVKLKQAEKTTTTSKETAAEEAAIAASEIKQAEISDAISKKMVAMCNKYWSKGEHRCYCQKHIEHAPPEIAQNSTCK